MVTLKEKINEKLERAVYRWKDACNDDKNKKDYEINLQSSIVHLKEVVKYAETMGIIDSEEYIHAKKMFDIVTGSWLIPNPQF